MTTRITTTALLAVLVMNASAADQPSGKRLSVPEAAAREKALATVREVFKPDIEKAKTLDEQRALAEMLMKTAADTKDDLVARFVLRQFAMEMASKQGDLTMAFAAIDEMAREFEIDELNVKSKTFVAISPKLTTKNLAGCMPLAMELLHRAIDTERFEIANAVGEPLSRLAVRLGEATISKDVAALRAEADRLERAFAKFAEAKKTLDANPTDSAANTKVGKYYLEKGNWKAALPYLALSEEVQYRDIAVKELAKPQETAARVSIADEWWKLGDADKTPLKPRLQNHAADLYKEALSNATGLLKIKIETRLEEVAKLAKSPVDIKPAASAKPPVARNPQTITNSIGLKLTLIPAGEFLMGSPETEQNRNPLETQHRVKITKPFYIGIFDVTRGQFAQFVAAEKYQTEAEKNGGGGGGYDAKGNRSTGYTCAHPGLFGNQQTDNHPVVCTTWNDAVSFCEWLSKKEGKKYRLPTEAEWEYACRAGTPTAFCFGEVLADDHANFQRNPNLPTPHPTLNCTTPVGTYKPNAAGLYDTHGNVWQWCQDWYNDYSNIPETSDPQGPSTGSARIRRGGSWNQPAVFCRTAKRSYSSPAQADSETGFRVVCEMGAVP